MKHKEILKHVCNTDRAQELSNYIDILLESSFVVGKEDASEESVNLRKVQSRLRDFFMVTGISDDPDFKERKSLGKLKEALEGAEKLSLSLTFRPQGDFLSDLYAWFSDNGFTNFLLDVEVKPEILGGFELVWGGKYMDKTLVSEVEKYVSKQ
jgi:hypothetical protein